jgi:hypothetical protein
MVVTMPFELSWENAKLMLKFARGNTLRKTIGSVALLNSPPLTSVALDFVTAQRQAAQINNLTPQLCVRVAVTTRDT